MLTGVVDQDLRLGPPMLLGGLVLLYIASRMLSNALTALRLGPGGRAMAHFVPIAGASLTAQFMGYPEIAIAIVFGTSVGAMTTVVGFIALSESVGPGPQHRRRIWPFVLAASIMVFLAGFKGFFGWRDALAMMIVGLAVAALWADHTEPAPENPPPLPSDAMDITALFHNWRPSRQEMNDTPVYLRVIELILLVAVVIIGAYRATLGTMHLSQYTSHTANTIFFSRPGIAASVVSLAMVMPMSYGVWRRAAGGRSWDPMTTQVGVVLLNLCLLLPVMALLPYAAALVPDGQLWGAGTFVSGPGIPNLLLYPAAFWRIDTIILITTGMLMLPVSMGKWILGREEGVVLLIVYVAYLVTIMLPGHWLAG